MLVRFVIPVDIAKLEFADTLPATILDRFVIRSVVVVRRWFLVA